MSATLLENQEIPRRNKKMQLCRDDNFLKSGSEVTESFVTVLSHSQPKSWGRAEGNSSTGARLHRWPGAFSRLQPPLAPHRARYTTEPSPTPGPAPRPEAAPRGNETAPRSAPPRAGPAMAAQAELGRLLADVELSCSCCLQHFTEPVRLASCSHSFCRPCIAAYCRGRQRATCPLCREGFELKDLRPNRELAALVSLVLNGGRGEGLGAWDEPRPSGDGAGGGWSSAGRRPGEKVGEGAAGASPLSWVQVGNGAVARAEITPSCFLLFFFPLSTLHFMC